MEEIYKTLIIQCPIVAARMYYHANLLERTLGNFDPGKDLSEYEVNGKRKKIKVWMLQDSATAFLNVWENINQ